MADNRFAISRPHVRGFRQFEGFQLVVDAVALNFLRGCEIDYVKEGLNESFVFNNVFESVGGSGMCSGCGGSGF